MLTYTLTRNNSISLYQQLYNAIRSDIETGRLKPHDKMPSKRSFAKNLGISVLTVENTYAQLVAEGYLYSLPKKGFYVQHIRALPRLNEDANNSGANSRKYSDLRNDLSPNIYSGITSGTTSAADSFSNNHFNINRNFQTDISSTFNNGNEDSNNSSGNGIDDMSPTPVWTDFSGNQTRPESFPFSIRAKIMRDLMRNQRGDLLTNSPANGIPALREAIADYLQSFRGLHISPDQIIISAGTDHLHSLLIQLLGLTKIYAMEDPGYAKVGRIYQSHGCHCRYLPLDENGVCVPDDHDDINVIHTSPSHHFPTGIVMPISRRYELLEWAFKAPDRFIIEDDYDWEFRLQGSPIPALKSIDRHDRVIYMNTFTKTLSSTVRIAYMILPAPLMALYHRKLSFYSCTVSTFEQYTMARFISDGYFEKHINRLRTYYHDKRDRLLTDIMTHPLADRVSITEENAGLHFLITFDTALSDEEVRERLIKKGIKINSLSQYYVQGEAKKHTFIINYTHIDESTMNEAIDVLLRSALSQNE